MGLMMLLFWGSLIVPAFLAIQALMQSGGRSAGQAESGQEQLVRSFALTTKA
jgi:hypothetical protein